MTQKPLAVALMIVGIAWMLGAAFFFASTVASGIGLLVWLAGLLWWAILEPTVSGKVRQFFKRKRVDSHQKQSLYDEQGGRCAYYGIKRQIQDMEVDHKVPIAKGGTNAQANLHITCRRCNNRKGTLADSQFRRRYNLTLARQTKGPPPTRIPYSYFEFIRPSRK